MRTARPSLTSIEIDYDRIGYAAAELLFSLVAGHRQGVGRIWHLYAGGQVIRTKAEHPFYRDGDGWVVCHD